MKKIILILSLLALPIVAYAANTGWNPKPDGVHAKSPMIPVFLNQTAIDALSPTSGSVVHNTTTGKNQWYNGVLWVDYDTNIFENISASGTVQAERVLVNAGTAVAPSIAIGQTDDGIFSSADGRLDISLDGAAAWKLTSNILGGNSGSTGAIINEIPSSTNPTLLSIQSDTNTGVGRAGSDQLSHIAGGIEGIRITEIASATRTDIKNSLGTSTETISSTDTLDNTNHTVWCDATSADVTLNLPTAVGIDGVEYRVKKIDSSNNDCILDGNGSETIDGVLTKPIIFENHAVSIKSDNTNWKIIQSAPITVVAKSYAIGATASGTQYVSGYYHGDSADLNLTQASPTGTHGAANEPAGAHAFWVHGAYAASGGSGAARLEISGTSFTSASGGTRTTTDSEVLIADLSTAVLDQYFETTKKWLGQITYTVICDGACTHTTYSTDGNNGHAKYDDLGSGGRLGFTIEDFEIVGFAGANDTGFDIQLIKHDGTGWTYAATGFVPGNGSLTSLVAKYSTESDLTTGLHFAFKIEDIGEFIDVASATQKEGYLIRIITTSNNAIKFATAHVGSVLP